MFIYAKGWERFPLASQRNVKQLLITGDCTKAEEEMKVGSEDAKLSVPSPDAEMKGEFSMQFVSWSFCVFAWFYVYATL